MNKLNSLSKFQLLLILLLAVSFACTQHTSKTETETNAFYTIPFAEIIKNQREIKLSEIVSDVEIIQLENTPEAFIGLFENIEYTKDYIFIQCWDQPVLQFSRSGKFIRHIGGLGKGPGEYNNCIKLSINEKDKRIYVQTFNYNIMVFDFNGAFLKTIQFPAMELCMKFWTWGRDSTLVSYLEPTSGNEPFVYIEYNEQGDTLQAINNYIFWNSNKGFGTLAPFKDQNFSYRFENKLHLKGCYNDTVYTYDENNSFDPKFFIDLGKHKLPEDMVYERKWTRPPPADLCWTGVHETTDYVFLPYGYHFNQDKPEAEREEKGLVLYNKKTKRGEAVKETKQGGFTDDIAGGPDFRPTITNDDTALMILSAMDMKSYLKSEKFKNSKVKLPEKKEKLMLINKTLREEDNHFLVIAKLK